MTSNAYVALKRLLPPPSLLVGKVTAHHTDDETSTVVLPTQQGVNEYAAGVATGSTIRARGTFVPVGANAFVRDGVIESRAPDENVSEIVIGAVVPVPMPPTFNGPIPDQVGPAGAAFTLDVSGYWSGGLGALSFSLAAGALPAGLTLSSTGVLSGTPTTEAVTGGLVLRATDAAGYRADSNAFEFDVTAPAVARWVAFRWDGSGAIMNSDDGATWAEAATAGSPVIFSACYGDGKFVGVGYNTGTLAARAIVSSDGTTWSSHSMSPGNVSNVAYGAGVFVASLESNAVRYSADGASWTSVTLPGSGNGRGLAFGAGVFVRLRYSGSNTARVLTSPDGVTWTVRTTPNLALDWISVAYSPALGMFAAVASGENGGSASNIMTSPDGITWTARTNPLPSVGWGCVGVAPDGSFVALGYAHGSVLRSSNGTTWTAAGGTVPSPPFDTAYRKIATYGSRMVAVGGSAGYRVYSDDNGATWTSVATTGQSWACVAARPD